MSALKAGCGADLGPGAGIKALDLGCGVGRHSLFLARNGFCVLAVDASANGLAFARAQAIQQGSKVADPTMLGSSSAGCPSNTIAFHQGPMTKLPQEWTVDYVLAWNVIYHGTLDVMKQSLHEMHRVLAASPNRGRIPGIMQATFLSTENHLFGKGMEISPRTYVIPDSDDEDKRHPHHYSNKAELERVLGEIGFKAPRFNHYEPENKPGHWHWEVVAQCALPR